MYTIEVPVRNMKDKPVFKLVFHTSLTLSEFKREGQKLVDAVLYDRGLSKSHIGHITECRVKNIPPPTPRIYKKKPSPLPIILPTDPQPLPSGIVEAFFKDEPMPKRPMVRHGKQRSK